MAYGSRILRSTGCHSFSSFLYTLFLEHGWGWKQAVTRPAPGAPAAMSPGLPPVVRRWEAALSGSVRWSIGESWQSVVPRGRMNAGIWVGRDGDRTWNLSVFGSSKGEQVSTPQLCRDGLRDRERKTPVILGGKNPIMVWLTHFVLAWRRTWRLLRGREFLFRPDREPRDRFGDLVSVDHPLRLAGFHGGPRRVGG